ncbi:MAG: hypothetical protein GC181_08280 [Bacteroidetes bacterium]|nr:hypothetical protein [Bacteroidota bacterium]
MLILHFIGLAMGLGTSIGFLFLGIASSKMEKEEGRKFMLKAMALSKMGNFGLVFLLLSGGYLATPLWSNLGNYPTFIAKLILFVVLGGLLGILSSFGKKAAKGEAEKYMPKIQMLGRFTLLTSLTIVVLAVLSFH